MGKAGMKYFVDSSGQKWGKVASTSWPEALLEVEGTKTTIGDDFARTRGWTEPHAILNQTNMVQPEFYIKDGSVVFAKDIMRLDKRPYWVNDVYVPWLGFNLWSNYCQPAFWREDTNTRPTDAITGEFKEQTIDCGCNLHHLLGAEIQTNKGWYQKIESVDYYSHIDIDKVNYYLTPHLIVKQVLASISQYEPVAYITHKTLGDLVVPNVARYPLIIPTEKLEKFPKLPLKTKYLGKDTTITAYNFSASIVHGLFSDGWRVIEESVITGNLSARFDRRVYVDEKDWIQTPPPTIAGFTKWKTDKFNWQL